MNTSEMKESAETGFEHQMPRQTRLANLPSEWRMATLGEVVASMKNGIYKPREAYAEDGIACLRMYNIDQGRIVWKDIKRMRISPDELQEYGLEAGDILVNRVNSRELVGKAATIPIGIGQCVFESKNIRIRLKTDLVEPRFVSFALLAMGRSYFNRNAQQVVGMASISQPQVAGFPLPLPQLVRQRRIVAEIEKQFTRLDAGMASLKRVQIALKRYRASVLKAACEGKLVETEAELVRQRGTGNVAHETGKALLLRILSERRTNWNGRGKYKEPVAPDTANLVPIPEDWAWASGEQLFCWSSGEGLNQKNIQKGQYPVYGGNGVTGYHKAFVAGVPTLVIGRVGALCGNVYLTDGPAWVTDNAIYAVQTPSCVVMRFALTAFKRAELNKRAAGSGQPFVNQRMLNETIIPLPPVAEQRRIVAEVERRLSVTDEVEVAVAANLRRAERLRQSILHHAFTGNL